MNTIRRRESFLPFHRPSFDQDELDAVKDTLESGWITTGPKTKRFEEEFRTFVGSSHAIGLNSCTAGLHLALVVLGIGPGDEVITTPVSFPASANVIVHQGATPVFADVEPGTLNIDVRKVEERITPRTKAILVVHLYGHPCEMDGVLDIATRHGLPVVEDAAHALESEYRGRKVGSIGDFTAFSFYATKNITTGEGGMLTTDNDELADKARILSLHGISRDAWKRYSDEGYRHWYALYPGYKYNMIDIQAALGLCQLKKVGRFLETRKRHVERYNEAFKDVPEIHVFTEKPYIKHAYHLYAVAFKTEHLKVDRDVLMNAIQTENIGIGIHFQSIHLHPYYKETFGFKRGDFPVAEYFSDRLISLPLYPKMTVEDVEYVIEVVRGLVAKYRK